MGVGLGSGVRNIEYKAELRDPALARTIARRIGAVHKETMQQTDTYYRIADARLKRREILFVEVAGHGQRIAGSERVTEYIRYERRDQARARASEYEVYSPERFRELYGERGAPEAGVVVRKVRELWMYDWVRVHIDRVEGLGMYIEFEAPVLDERPVETCREVVAGLIEAFRPAMGEAIARGYADLLPPPPQDAER